ncbi:putative sulfate exporter family transporter, partial [bacterium]
MRFATTPSAARVDRASTPVRPRAASVVVPLVAAGVLVPGVSSGMALVAGVLVALTVGNPWPERTRALAHKALAWSIVGLGAGMDLALVGRVGLHGLGY